MKDPIITKQDPAPPLNIHPTNPQKVQAKPKQPWGQVRTLADLKNATKVLLIKFPSQQVENLRNLEKAIEAVYNDFYSGTSAQFEAEAETYNRKMKWRRIAFRMAFIISSLAMGLFIGNFLFSSNRKVRVLSFSAEKTGHL